MLSKKSTVPKKIARGDLGLNVAGSVGSVLVRRKTRPGLGSLTPATILGAGLGFLDALVQNPSFRKGVKEIAIVAGGMTGGAAAMSLAIGARVTAKMVKKATYLVGKSLFEESKKNDKLTDFLKSYRYTVINGKGNIVGTNRKRFLGIGRLRLDNKKILAGNY